MDGRHCRSVAVSLLFLVLSAEPVYAQTGAIVGHIVGSDTDWPIVGALVEARDADNRAARSVLTDQEGAFRIAGLRPGSYALSVAAVGYGTQGANTVRVTAGDTVTVAITLEPRPIDLNPLVVTSSRKAEKALEAPAHVEVIAERDIDVRPALTVVDHLRATPAVDVVTGGLSDPGGGARLQQQLFGLAAHAYG
jgi:iron complex outermembrane receptor protein